MRKIIPTICIVIITTYSIQAQTTKQRRDWIVGHYLGYWKDSTANTAWTAGTEDINYSNNTLNPNSDSMVIASDGTEYYVSNDSSLWAFYNGPYANNGGKLMPDSNLIYYYITPSMGGGHLRYFKGKMTQSYAGIKEVIDDNEQLNLYPNPVQNSLQVISSNEQITEIKIYDVLGKEAISTKEKNIDVSGLQEGVYFLQVKTVDGTATKKIIVQR